MTKPRGKELSARESLDGNTAFVHKSKDQAHSQVFVNSSGELVMHDDVVFEANVAGASGGAVSFTSGIGLNVPVVIFCDKCHTGWV